ncbi:hypothetical protein [Shewanella algae]|uniref:hypothetical protein n=1 Tax=Shewanella algae TaxID=38313 RepID=UPI0030079DEF
MKVKEFLENFSAQSQRIANDIFEYIDFLSHKKRDYKNIREEQIPLLAYIKCKKIPHDADMELGGEAHDFDAKFIYSLGNVRVTQTVEIVQALPMGEHEVRLALVHGKMDVSMRLKEYEQLRSFPKPIIDAINKKHQKNYADKRVLLVSVIGEHTYEDDALIKSWIPEIRRNTFLGNFTEIFLAETARSVMFKIH